MWRIFRWLYVDSKLLMVGLTSMSFGAAPITPMMLNERSDAPTEHAERSATPKKPSRRSRSRENRTQVYRHGDTPGTRLATLSWSLSAAVPVIKLTGVEISRPSEGCVHYGLFTSKECELFAQAVHLVYDLDEKRRQHEPPHRVPKHFVPLRSRGVPYPCTRISCLSDAPERNADRLSDWLWLLTDAHVARPDRLCFELIAAFHKLSVDHGIDLRIRLALDESELIGLGVD